MGTDVLTLQEIERQYPDQWVILDNILADPGPVLKGGRVIYSSPDEQEAFRYVKQLPTGFHIAVRYMGFPPDDIAFAL